MPRHSVLYRSSQAIGATNASLAAIGFSQDTVTNNKILPFQDCKLGRAIAMGTGLASARIVTPLLQMTASSHLRPLNVATAWPSNPGMAEFMQSPVNFRKTENIDVQTTNTDAAAQVHTAILHLLMGSQAIPAGQRLKIRATSSTTLTAAVWNRVPLIFDDNLPDKTYAVVGLEVFSATGIIGRLDMIGSSYRPGVACVTALGNRMNDSMYDNAFGELGRFTNQALPSLEIFATAADTASTVWMDIVVIG